MSRALPAFYLTCWLVFAALMLMRTELLEFPNSRLDENGHYAYAHHLATHNLFWPDFGNFPLYDASTGHALAQQNFINHPPLFYWLGHLIEPLAIKHQHIAYRSISIAFGLLSMGLYFLLGSSLRFHLSGHLIYAALPFMCGMHKIIGFFNNDAAVILGGMLAIIAAKRWLEQRSSIGWLIPALLLSSVKLTGFLLVGAFIGFTLFSAYFSHQRLKKREYALGIAIYTLCALPYLWLWFTYGSPAPNTIGQVAHINAWALQNGTSNPLLSHFLYFVPAALEQLCHSLNTPILTALLLSAIIVGFPGALRQAHPIPRPLMWGVCTSTALMLALHIWFAWLRYLEYRWPFDMQLRYYFPLIAGYGLMLAQSATHHIRKWGAQHHTA